MSATIVPRCIEITGVLLLISSPLVNQGVTLAWNPNPEPDISGYNLYYGEISTAAQKTNVGNVTTYTISSLTTGRSYYFYVTAYNTASLESDPSAQVTYTVPASNTAPIISDIPNQTVNEDNPTGTVGFTVRDNETAAASLAINGASSNPGLVPNGNIVFGGSGTNRTVRITPMPNQSGFATITVTVSDGTLTANDSFVLTVNAVNDAPTVSSIADQNASQGSTVGPISFSVGDQETAAGSLVLTGSSSNPTLLPNANIVFGGSGGNRTLTITPARGQSGTANISITVSDGTASASDSFVLTVGGPVNGPVTFTNSAAITIQDVAAASLYPSTVTVSEMGGTVENVTIVLKNLTHTWTSDIDALLVGPGGKSVLLMSDAGSGAVNNSTLTFSDSAGSALPSSVALSTGSYRPANYSDGSVGADNFPTPAPVPPYGSALSVFSGEAPNGTWSLYISDDGPQDVGSLAGGWTLTVTTSSGGSQPPQPPTISDIPNQTTSVSTPTSAIPFTIADADTPAGNLALTRDSSNSTLLPVGNIVLGGSGANRTITLNPASGQSGTATVTVSVSDGSFSASDTFVLTVNVVNTAPIISDIGDQTVNEDSSSGAIAFTIGDNESSGASLLLSSTSSNPALVPNGSIVFGGSGTNRTITVTPAAHQSGTSTITVTVSDGSLTATDTFLVTVNAVNDPPVISNVGNQTINEDSATTPIGFGIGDVETSAASLVLSGSSSNPALVPNGNVVFGGSGTNRTVTITPVANQSGTSTITLSVSDGALTAGDSLILTVTAVNDPPAILNIGNQTINEDSATAPISFSVSDIETSAASLVVSGTSSNPALVPTGNIVFGGSGTNRTVTVIPLDNQFGTATITVGVSDGNQTNSEDFVLTVNEINDAPVLSDIGDRTIDEDGSTSISFTVSDVDTSAGSLVLSANSYNIGLVSNANLVFGGTGTNRTLTVTPLSNQSGTATITVTLSDGSLSDTDTFTLTVNPVNDVPTISNIPDQTIYVNSSTGPIDFTIGDTETGPDSLVLSGSSSNPTLVPNGNIVFGGSGANRTVRVTPAFLRTGTATITVSVSDGTATSSDSFVLTVRSLFSLGIARSSGRVLNSGGTSLSALSDTAQPVLEINGAPGTSYQIEASEDFVSWKPVGTFQSTTGTGTFRDTSSGNLVRFYRVKECP